MLVKNWRAKMFGLPATGGKIAITVSSFLIFITVLAAAAHPATVKLKTGEVYEDVTPDVFDFYKTILFEYEGQRISVNFTDIESITDAAGRDITSKVLGEADDAPRGQFLSEGPKSNAAVDNLPWKAMLSFGANYSIPTGDYYEGLTSGIGFDGDVRIAVTDKIAIQIIVSRSGMKSDKNYQPFKDNPFLMDAIRVRTTRYEMAANFFQPFSADNPTHGMWYNFVGLGVANHTVAYNYTITGDDMGEIYSIKDSYSEDKLVIVLGVGATAMLSNRYGVDLSVTADLVPFITGKYSPEGKGANFSYIFDFKLGMATMF
jgi:hypothetical protein